MAKAKNKKQRVDSKVYQKDLKQIKDIFPKVKVTKKTDIDPQYRGRDFFVEIFLPKDFTLKGKTQLASGEITSISFSVQQKYCEKQKSGLYIFSVS